MNLNKKPQTLAQLKLVTFAIIMSVSILNVVIFVLHGKPDNPLLLEFVMPKNPVMLYAFCVMALLVGVISSVLPKFMISKSQNQNPEISSGIFFNWNELTPDMFKVSLARIAFCESIAILGFVLSFQTKSALYVLAFSLVSLFFIFLWSPFNKKGCA